MKDRIKEKRMAFEAEQKRRITGGATVELKGGWGG